MNITTMDPMIVSYYKLDYIEEYTLKLMSKSKKKHKKSDKKHIKDKNYKMQKFFYLEELGLNREDCCPNFTPDCSKFIKERKKYGYDSRNTYSLDITFAQWLYSNIKLYIDNAKDVICIDSYIVKVEDKNVYLIDALNDILSNLESYFLSDKELPHDNDNYLIKASHIWADIVPAVWW